MNIHESGYNSIMTPNKPNEEMIESLAEIAENHRDLIENLQDARRQRCFPPPIRRLARAIGRQSLGLLFPHFAERIDCDALAIEEELHHLIQTIQQFQTTIEPAYPQQNLNAGEEFVHKLSTIHQELTVDAQAIFYGDPAANSIDEVILTYPGFLAIAVYRISHRLLEVGIPLLPRMVSEWAHSETGVDIHPGAIIGSKFFIDHGTGTVIGETCVIGNGVKLYQGVTLGAVAVSKVLSGAKRHPTIEDDVVVYANATILGGDTVIGHDSVIGGNAWVTSSVPPFSIVNRQSDVRARSTAPDESIEWHI